MNVCCRCSLLAERRDAVRRIHREIRSSNMKQLQLQSFTGDQRAARVWLFMSPYKKWCIRVNDYKYFRRASLTCQLLSSVRGDVMNLLDDVCLSFLFRSSDALNAAEHVKLFNLTVEPKIVQTHWQTSWRCVKLPSRTEVYGEFGLSNTMHAGKSASLSFRNFYLNDLIDLCPVSPANKSIKQSPSDADVSVRGYMRSKRPSDASDTSSY